MASSGYEHCAVARSFTRVVRYRLAGLLLVVEDGSVATIDKTDCGAVGDVEESGDDVPLDAHTARMMPQQEHRGHPDPIALGESESEHADVDLRLRHVRVASDRKAARQCDPSLYLSGTLETQTFWVAGWPKGEGSNLKSEAGLPRTDIEQREEEEKGTLRKFTCLLTRLRELACREAAWSP